jgi:predicted dehydrogenase
MALKVAVIGAGAWAVASHLPNLAQRPEVEFSGVCRPGRDALDWVAKTYGFAIASEDHRDVLDASPDIVVVSSPTALHYEHARDALLAGAHVLVEKPFTLTADQAWDLVRLAHERGRHLLIAFGYNYRPLVVDAHRELRAHGGVGPIESLSVTMSSVCRELLAGRGSYPKADSRAQPDQSTWSDPSISGGGYAQAQLSHALGVALHLFDVDVATVFGHLASPLGGVEQHCSAVVNWSNNATGVLAGNATHEFAESNRDILRVHAVGADGQFRLDMERDRFAYFRTAEGELSHQGRDGDGAYDCVGPVDALVDLALGRTEFNPSPGSLGARTVEVIEAMYRSAATGEVAQCARASVSGAFGQ